ncbi:hypothetical protein [Ruminococcus gauvreauii]|uniref:Lipoprotein n=1 Tax=Ruminococcus gauvreauii TaxID=438033 RepID=A0ABY5VKM2_9FIRM|nr:hypothetical protein [Ruminococcus gauvreauii]UWP60440.1 hypothetical protein NQ502_05200 [Ruminococcus gauvreauii]
MKKKIIAIVLCLAITLSVVACGGTNDKKETAPGDSLPAGISQGYSDDVFNIDSLPVSISYGNGKITIESLETECKEINYSNEVYATVILDVSTLSENELHYLGDGNIYDSDKDMQLYLMTINPDSDKVESVDPEDLSDKYLHLNRNDTVYENGKFTLKFDSIEDKDHRNTFSGKKITLSLDLRQDQNSNPSEYFYDTTIE